MWILHLHEPLIERVLTAGHLINESSSLIIEVLCITHHLGVVTIRVDSRSLVAQLIVTSSAIANARVPVEEVSRLLLHFPDSSRLLLCRLAWVILDICIVLVTLFFLESRRLQAPISVLGCSHPRLCWVVATRSDIRIVSLLYNSHVVRGSWPYRELSVTASTVVGVAHVLVSMSEAARLRHRHRLVFRRRNCVGRDGWDGTRSVIW